MRNEINFISPKLPISDLELFFGPLDKAVDGPFHNIEDGMTLAHVMHAAKIFPSVKQAKQNGWNQPISPGYSEYVVGKQKLSIYILAYFEQ